MLRWFIAEYNGINCSVLFLHVLFLKKIPYFLERLFFFGTGEGVFKIESYCCNDGDSYSDVALAMYGIQVN